MHGVRVPTDFKLGHKVLFEKRAQYLRSVRWDPLVHRAWVMSEVPFDLQTSFVLFCIVVHTVQHSAGYASRKDCVRNPQRSYVYTIDN